MEEQAPTEDDPLLGQSVGNYVVRSKLGEGGMGAVYMAEHPLIGKKVALKVLHPDLSSKQEVVERFFHEAKAVNDIQHPNIVDIIDYGTVKGENDRTTMVYFIMEFLNGHSLTDVLRSNAPLPPDRALHIAAQIGDALAASHRSGIVHRDLKPDNIILVPKRHEPDFVKVLDFGIAKLTGDGHQSKTRTGIVMGTPAYMSPEQCEGRGQIDHRTDVYALGIVLYEMLTGQVPFSGEGYGEVLVQHLTQVPQPPSSITREVFPHLEVVVLKALAKSRDQRFPSMQEFVRALADPVGYVEAHGGLGGFLGATLTESDGPAPHLYSRPGSAMTPQPGMYTPPPGTLTTPYPGSPHTGYPGAQPTPPPVAQTGVGAAPVTQWPGDPRGRRGLWIGLAAVVLVLGGVGLAVGLAGGGGEEVAAASPADGGPGSAGSEGAAAAVPAAVVFDAAPVAPPDAAAKVVPAPPKAPAMRKVHVDSSPEGAQVVVNGKMMGVTPADFELENSKQPVTLQLVLDGYEERSVSITPNRALTLGYDLRKKPERRVHRNRTRSNPTRKKTVRKKIDSTGVMRPSF